MNMIVKLFEVRDRGTLVPWLAMRVSYPQGEAEQWLMGRGGFGPTIAQHEGYIFQGPFGPSELTRQCGAIGYDPFEVPNLRMREMALHIQERFDELESGDVIDIEYILGEKPEAKKSERRDG